MYIYAGNLYTFICSMLSENEISPEDAAAGCVEAMVQACITCENLQLTASNSSMSGLSPNKGLSGLLVLSIWWQAKSFSTSGPWAEAC